MNPFRILAAAIVGGIITFGWGAFLHMATPVGEMGLKSLPPDKEQILAPAIRYAFAERGIYMFPNCDHKEIEKMKEPEKTKAWDEYCKKYSEGPRGIIIYDPEKNVSAMSPKMLGAEFGSNLLACLVLAFVISKTKSGAGTGALIGLAAGLFASFSIDVSYWNWYRFPSEMVTGSLIEQGVGGLLAGLTIGLILGRSKSQQTVLA